MNRDVISKQTGLSKSDVDAVIVANGFQESMPDAVIISWLKKLEAKGLSPFDDHINLLSFGNRYTTITTIDAMRLMASKTGAYAGNDAAVFNGGMSEHEHRNEDKNYPMVAKVVVWRIVQGQRVPFSAEAGWDSYYPGDGPRGNMWRKFPYLMLGKVAEALALRKGFPDPLHDMYVSEEFDQVDSQPVKPGETMAETYDAKEIAKKVKKVRSISGLAKLYEELPTAARQNEDILEILGKRKREIADGEAAKS